MDRHNNPNNQCIIVPPARLSPNALDAIIEEFVTRSGTDYGRREATLAEKCAAIQSQLTAGRVVIVFDPSTQTCTIALSEDVHRPGTARREKGVV